VKRALLLLGILALSIGAMAASVTYPVKFNDSSLDSVMIIIYDDWSVDDTAIVKSFPADTTLTLDDVSIWKICYRYYWAAASGVDTMGLPSCEVVELSGGTATHGAGDWTSGSVTGDGSDNLIFVAVDTTDHYGDPPSGAATEGAIITVRNAATAVVAILRTNGAGMDTATLNIGDAYTFTAYGPAGYVWHGEAIASMAGGTDTMLGYNYLPGASPPSTPGTSTIYGWLTTAVGDSLYGAIVTAYREGCETAVDSGSNVIISGEVVHASTNTSGYWSLNLVNSDEYDKAECGYYTLEAFYDGKTVFKTKRLWITGGFNVADSISARP